MTQTLELLSRALPKWPQMIVTGEPVTVEQAKDIIFRTDRFLTDASEYSGGNARDFNDDYRERAGLNEIRETFPKTWWDMVPHAAGYIDTQYVRNDWGSCAFVFGPHGWCHPDGTIRFNDNVGKWPSVEDVLNDWTLLAEAFPFLNLHVTLMSGESMDEDTKPVVNIRVQSGTASVCEPDLSVHSADITPLAVRSLLSLNMAPEDRELGLLDSWYDEYAEKVRAVVDTLLAQGSSMVDSRTER